MRIFAELFVYERDGVTCPTVTVAPHPANLVIERHWNRTDEMVRMRLEDMDITVSVSDLRRALDAVTR